MIPRFTAAEQAVHYPDDRRSFVAVKPYMVVLLGGLLLGAVGLAWGQYLLWGLPWTLPWLPPPQPAATRPASRGGLT
ncbi:hypothetical protein ACFQT0_31175 [Hymenobacter humi]|uniref:Uncharacterized protein n=1 Tax=Hymenobacter humi TaxID=1411620 RepID=A0ABW2UGA9_9BACT